MPSGFDMLVMTVKFQNSAQAVLLQQLKVLNMVTVQSPRLMEKCKKYSIIVLQVKWSENQIWIFLTTKSWILFENEKTNFIVVCYWSEKSATNIKLVTILIPFLLSSVGTADLGKVEICPQLLWAWDWSHWIMLISGWRYAAHVLWGVQQFRNLQQPRPSLDLDLSSHVGCSLPQRPAYIPFSQHEKAAGSITKKGRGKGAEDCWWESPLDLTMRLYQHLQSLR